MNYLTDILGGFLDICREGKTGVVHAGTGTAATTSSDATVTGTGTAFLTEIEVGDIITIGSVTGEVLSVASDTSLELTANAASSVSTVAFTITKAASEVLAPSSLAANWEKVADVENYTFAPKVQTEEVMKPNEAGGYSRKKKITKQADLDIIVDVNDFTELITELILLASGAITSSFTPMSGDGMVRGWYRFRMRNTSGAVVTTLTVWAELSAEQLALGNSVPKPKLTIAVLQNSKNSGTSTLSA